MITIKWNYKGWVEHPYPDWTQDMWNQMLFTKINEASARIHMKKLLSPATHIKIHRSLMLIIERMEYFKKLNDGELIIGRYKIILDNNVPYNEVIVFDIKDEDLEEAPIKIIIENI